MNHPQNRTMKQASDRSVKHPSPPLSLVAVLHVALFIAGLAASTALAGGHVFPSPFEPERAGAYFLEHGGAVRVAGFFLFASAVPLAVFAATATSRLAFFGIRVAGVNIAFLGGAGASLMLLASGLCLWALGLPGTGASPEVARLLHLLAFASVCLGFAVTFGLLVLGVSLAGGLARRLPRWLMWVGIGVGLLAELSSLSLLVNEAAFLLPLTRFPGLFWLLAVGARLPAARERESASERDVPVQAAAKERGAARAGA